MYIVNHYSDMSEIKGKHFHEYMACILNKMYNKPPTENANIIYRWSLPYIIFANCVEEIATELTDSTFPEYLIDSIWIDITRPDDAYRINQYNEKSLRMPIDYYSNYKEEVPLIFGGVYFCLSIFAHDKTDCLELIKQKALQTGDDYAYFKAFEEKVTEYRNIISKDAQAQKEEEAIFADEAETNALKEKITQLETLNIDLTKREDGYKKQIDFLNEDFRKKIEATSEKESKYKEEIDELKKQIDQLNSDINVQTPNKYKLTEGKKTDFIKIISAMYELRLFSTTDGRIANNKQKLFDELGKFFNENFKDYSKALSQAKQQNNFLNVFDDLKTKADDYYKKESKINK